MTRGMRLLYSIVFGVVFWILGWVLAVVTVLQLLLLLITGQMSDELRGFGRNLAHYAAQVIEFLTGVRDALPFPFTDWPDAARTPGDDAPSGGASGGPPSV